MSDSQLKSLETYTRLMSTNASAHVFRAAVDLEVFDALANGQKTAAEIAVACDAKLEPLELLLDTLCLIGVVEKYGDLFALAQVMHLLPRELRDLGDRYWQHLPEFVRTGKPVSQAETSSLDETDFHREAAASQWSMTPAALDLIRVLRIGDQRRGLDVLELAAGSAVWSLAVAHYDPECRLTIVDKPVPLAAARSHAQAIGLSDRIAWIEEDYRNVDLPAAGFDLAILANAMNLEPLEANAVHFQKIFDWLRPGGELVIVSVFPGQTDGALEHGLYRLAMALRTDMGRLHGPEQLQAALLDAGFEKPQFAQLPAPPHIMGMMVAAKGL